MNDINAVSPKFTFILFADDTTMISSMYTFTSVMRQDTACIADNINEELSKISDWLAVNKLSLKKVSSSGVVVGPQARLTG